MPKLLRVWATEGKHLRKNLILAFEGIRHELSTKDTESILQHSSKDVAADKVEEAKKSMQGLDLAESDDEGTGLLLHCFHMFFKRPKAP
jgi:hypothetical protein